MEDAHCSIPSFITTSSKLADLESTPTTPIHFFGVFDGHGGQDCAVYVNDELPKRLKAALQSSLPAIAASVMAHSSTESAWMCSGDRDDSGTTAVTALVESENSRVMVSNVGDSRAVIIRRSGGKSSSLKVVALTTDQDACNRSEAKRIKAAHGVIDEDGYINRGLTSNCVGVQTARSLGDFDVKFPSKDLERGGNADDSLDVMSPTFHSMSVIAVPECTWCQLEDDDVLVLGCDGMFEATQGNAAWIAKSVKRLVSKDCSAQEMSEALASEAIEMGSMDNVSCIIVLPQSAR
jgi:serine/threonine protein phosphatase PrpC